MIHMTQHRCIKKECGSCICVNVDRCARKGTKNGNNQYLKGKRCHQQKYLFIVYMSYPCHKRVSKLLLNLQHRQYYTVTCTCICLLAMKHTSIQCMDQENHI